MAILLEEKKKAVSATTLIIIFAVIIAAGLGAYFLFFAPAPVIDIVVPESLRATEELKRVEFDPGAVVNSGAFRNLRPDTSVPSIGNLGRDNPFLSF